MEAAAARAENRTEVPRQAANDGRHGGPNGRGGAAATGGVAAALAAWRRAGGVAATGGVAGAGGVAATGGVAAAGGAAGAGGVAAPAVKAGRAVRWRRGGAPALQARPEEHRRTPRRVPSSTLLRLQNARLRIGNLGARLGRFRKLSAIRRCGGRRGAHRSYGAVLNDTGTGVPAIQQKLPVTASLVGKTVTVTAWVRLVSFPAMRLLLEANLANGVHLNVNFSDTNASDPNWQKLSAQLMVPNTADHLMFKVSSSVATADGITYADDAQLCIEGLCSPCAGP